MLDPLWSFLRTFVVGLLSISPAGSPALAETGSETPMRRVSFSVERSVEIENDVLAARLGITAEHPDPAKLADEVNATMRWALERARAAKDVRARTGGYHTFPISEKGRIQRWRATQELLLDSTKPESLSALVGTLQERLQVGALEFSVSDERRREAEDRLIAAALEAFRARAAHVVKTLGAGGSEIVHLDVQTHGASPPPQPYGRAYMASAEVAKPALEAGESTVRVAVSATIELR